MPRTPGPEARVCEVVQLGEGRAKWSSPLVGSSDDKKTLGGLQKIVVANDRLFFFQELERERQVEHVPGGLFLAGCGNLGVAERQANLAQVVYDFHVGEVEMNFLFHIAR